MSEQETTQQLFEHALEYINSHKQSLSFTQDQQLKLYGLFKQITVGKCNVSKPGIWDFAGRAKWNSWNSLGDMSKEEAEKQYIYMINELVPNWNQKNKSLQNEEQENKITIKKEKKKGMVVFSRPILAEGTIDNNENDKGENEEITLFSSVSNGNIEQMKNLLDQGKYSIDDIDDNGMSALHWACDRGNELIVKELLNRNANVNIQDEDGQTPLHCAAMSENESIVNMLLGKGADKSLRSNEGELACTLSDNETIKTLLQSS